MMETYELLLRAKAAAPQLAALSADKKNEALLAMAAALIKDESAILAANERDMSAHKDIGAAMLDRLALSPARIRAMADGIRQVAALPDPVGVVLERITRPNGLRIEKRTVPLGVVGVIFESRPNVTSDVAALCLKSGNACVLKCGKEAFETARAIVLALRSALDDIGLDPNFVCMPDDLSRDAAQVMMSAVGVLDALIPRGGAGLIKACVNSSKVPCIQTGTGICHIYVDGAADADMALNIVENAKTSRPSVCNAAEVLLVARSIAADFLPKLKARLVDERVAAGLVPVELRLDEKAAAVINGVRAGENDFDTEFLDYILAVKVVSGVDEAIAHIAKHSTHHSEAIVTADGATAEKFLALVDSAAVYHNASTRFTDGGEFGKGCEIGISTQKLHARGPMGLSELTSYKYVVRGNGNIR